MEGVTTEESPVDCKSIGLRPKNVLHNQLVTKLQLDLPGFIHFIKPTLFNTSTVYMHINADHTKRDIFIR